MGKYIIILSAKAEKDLKRIYQSGDKGSIKKIGIIFEELVETPYKGTGNPEALKYDFKGYWSRRICQKERLIYAVKEDIISVYVISASGHYQDK